MYKFKQSPSTPTLIYFLITICYSFSYSTQTYVLTQKITQLSVNTGQFIRMNNKARIINVYDYDYDYEGDDIQYLERSIKEYLVKAVEGEQKYKGNQRKLMIQGMGVIRKYTGLDGSVDGPILGHGYQVMAQQGVKKYKCKQGYAGQYCLLPITTIKQNQVSKKLNLNQNQKTVLYFQQPIKIKSSNFMDSLTITYCYNVFLKQQCFPYNKNTIINKYPFYLVIQTKNLKKITVTQDKNKDFDDQQNKQVLLQWSIFKESLRSNGPKFSYEVIQQQTQNISIWRNNFDLGLFFVAIVLGMLLMVKIFQYYSKSSPNIASKQINNKLCYLYEVKSIINMQ